MIQTDTHPRSFNSKTCPICNAKFQGRQNRQYCSQECKTRHNNELGRERRQEEKSLTGDYLKNYKLLNELLGKNGDAPLTIDSKILGLLGFNPEAPVSRKKIDGVLTYCFGDIGIQPDQTAQTNRIFRNP